MKDDKKIENLFREKLENYAAPPPPHIWNNVQGELAAQKRQKRRALIGWISAAAVIVLAFLAGWYFNTTSELDVPLTAQKEMVQTNPANSENELGANTIVEEKNTAQTKISVIENPVISKPVKRTGIELFEANSDQNTKFIASESNSRKFLDVTEIKSIEAKFIHVQNGIRQLKTKSKPVTRDLITNAEQFQIAQNIKNSNGSTSSENNWKMGMYVSPGYSSHTANHSDNYNQQITYSNNNGNANVSGGVSVQYKTGKKWSVESGVYYAQNGQKAENSFQLFAFGKNSDLMYDAAPIRDNAQFSNAVQVDNGNLQMNSTAGVIAFDGIPKGAEIAANFESLATGSNNALFSNGEFLQIFEFVEIPLYLRYRLLDSKFGVELLGGVNAGLVVGNNAYIDNEYGLQNIGNTQDISTLNISGTVGLGLNYVMSKHFSLAVEPRFNYYLNSINKNPEVDFRPYRIGFFTGLYYEF